MHSDYECHGWDWGLAGIPCQLEWIEGGYSLTLKGGDGDGNGDGDGDVYSNS